MKVKYVSQNLDKSINMARKYKGDKLRNNWLSLKNDLLNSLKLLIPSPFTLLTSDEHIDASKCQQTHGCKDIVGS